MDDTLDQRSFLAIMLGALIKRAGGEVRVTMEELDGLDPLGSISPYQDPETSDIILRIREGLSSMPAGGTMQ